MRACLSVLRIRAACELQYRAAALSGMVTQFFWGLLLISIYKAFYESSGQGEFAQVATYVWLQQAFFRLMLGGDNGIYQAINDGGIAYELCRPLHPYIYWSMRDVACRFASSSVRAALMIPLALLIPAPYNLSLPVSTVALVMSFTTLLLGICISTATIQILNAYVIRTLDRRGLANIFSGCLFLFSGNLLPLTLFPESWQPLLRAQPFAQVLDIPIRLYTGQLPVSEMPVIILTQVMWLLVLTILGLWAWNANLKRLVVQGG